MTAADLDRVIEIAESLKQAPQWPRTVYEAASAESKLLPNASPLWRRTAATGTVAGLAVASLTPPEAELETIVVADRLPAARGGAKTDRSAEP